MSVLLFLFFLIQITELLYKDERFSKGTSKPAGKDTSCSYLHIHIICYPR